MGARGGCTCLCIEQTCNVPSPTSMHACSQLCICVASLCLWYTLPHSNIQCIAYIPVQFVIACTHLLFECLAIASHARAYPFPCGAILACRVTMCSLLPRACQTATCCKACATTVAAPPQPPWSCVRAVELVRNCSRTAAMCALWQGCCFAYTT